VAAIGLVLLGIGLWGAVLAIGAADDLAALTSECAQGACAHAGTLVDRQRTSIPGGRLYDIGSGVDYCALTLDLDSGERQAAIPGSICERLAVPSAASAEIWRGRIVSVHTTAGSWITPLHPSNSLFQSLLRLLALVPFALCVMIIQYDVTSHRPVWKVHRHWFGLR
jgi:hypothetical protein